MYELDKNKLHIWLLDTGYFTMSMFEELLTPGEVAQANRYRQAVDRKRHVLSRGGLRWLLAKYTGIQSLDLQFNPYGKPYLDHPVRFNVAHAGSHIIYGFAIGTEIGVDIEQITPMPDMQDVAQLVFTDAERRYMREADTLNRFYRLWTAKEAFIKAVGEGFSYPVGEFAVNFSQVPAFGHATQDLSIWRLHQARVDDYRWAVVWQGDPREVVVRDMERECL